MDFTGVRGWGDGGLWGHAENIDFYGWNQRNHLFSFVDFRALYQRFRKVTVHE